MQFGQLKRREFITLLGGAGAAWPLAVRAQPERVRRIGVLMNSAADDAESHARLVAFRQGLQQLGWTDGHNVQVDVRWGMNDVSRLLRAAEELVASAPDAILAGVGGTSLPLMQATRTVPIVFAQGIDPVGIGQVASMARPGGNVTGFTQFEFTLSGKWPQVLKEIAPEITRAAILRNPSTPGGIGQWAVIQAAASSTGMEVSPVGIRDGDEIERGITAFANSPNGGLIVVVSALTTRHRQLIVELAARHRLPAVYPYRYYVAGGGLISYGVDLNGLYRRAAGYVDRILKGAKPADLPIQAPTKYELVINLKTAKALGLTVPPMLLAPADEVID
jgi:putative tryptophan/tyrosine transport system substrate-binding protein